MNSSLVQGFISSGVLGRPRNSDLSPPRTYGITVGYEFKKKGRQCLMKEASLVCYVEINI